MINYKEEVLMVYPKARCYHMEYMGEFYFVVYAYDHKRHCKKTEAKAWKYAWREMQPKQSLLSRLKKLFT